MKTHKILVVVDMQNDFITGPLGSEEAKAAKENIMKRIRNFDGELIIFTQDTHTENYMYTKEGKHLPVRHCIVNTVGWEIPLDLVEEAVSNPGLPTAIKIGKRTFGSDTLVSYIRGKYDLEEQLEIELVGVCTDICVIANAVLLKTAFYENADITVYSDCCAGVTVAKHEAALEVMKSLQINVK